ncbi:MAG: peroxide stress protein YaaA, partial [Pseudomonadota bacterium]
LVNCASQEYFGAVDLKALKLDVVTPQFLEEKDGKQKMVSFFAKKARGAMARFVVTQRVTDAYGIKDFDLGGYAFDAEQSTPEKPVFVRPYPDTKT